MTMCFQAAGGEKGMHYRIDGLRRLGRATPLAAAAAGLACFVGCASGAMSIEAAAEEGERAVEDYGVLVMAHGGKEEWNRAVLEAVEPLREQSPVEVALGMADAATIQEAVAELQAQGVMRIGVVRLFVSGESWYRETRQILGLESGAPPKEDASPAEHSAHGHELWRIATAASFALTREGLSQASEMGGILVDRARALSEDPLRESVVLLAHGPADDEEDKRWLDRLRGLGRALRVELPFRRVEAFTLREDWPEKREEAEREIRAVVEELTRDGGRCLVIPFRVFGFGPYAEVLEGLEYVSDGRGLLPHSLVTDWMARQSEILRRGPFEMPDPAAASATPTESRRD